MCTLGSRDASRGGTIRIPWFALLVLGSAAVQGLAVEKGSAAPWDTAFAGDAAALRRAADAIPVPEGKGFEILLRDVSWTLDASGRATTRDRTVVRLFNEAGVQEWASFQESWAPWYQRQPSIRARVIGTDGVSHALDPKTIAEGSASDESEDIYSDRRIVRAPLPNLSPGAIVEQEFEIVESAPLLDAGGGHQLAVSTAAKVRRLRFELTAPATLSVRYAVHGISRDAVRREEGSGMIRLRFDGGPFEPFEDWETGMPGEARLGPLFSFSTGRSWREVAVRYAQIVDDRIAAGSADGVLRELAAKDGKRSADLAVLLTRLHARVRYTGVEFGDAAIVPASPLETWKRGYGDCKDKAVLLVALLRAAGARAHVALLASGYGRDLDASLPGFSGFNHAIVAVEADEGKQRVWIDATDTAARPGDLPESDQGRLALIASEDTRELTRIPKSEAGANGMVETREFFLAEVGSSRLVVTQEPRGTRESAQRSQYQGRAAKDLQETVERRAASYYLGKKVEKLDYPDSADLSRPFRVKFEVPEAGRGLTAGEESVVAILPEEWLLHLSAFRSSPDSEEEDAPVKEKKNKARKTDFVWNEPFTDEWRYRVAPPEGYVPAGLPESGERSLGPITLTQEYRAETNGIVTATIRLTSGKERITAAEFESARTEVKRLAELKPFMIRFESVGGRHLAAGRTREALAEYRRLVFLHPREALHHEQMARALLQGGLGEAARQQARLAVGCEPASARAQGTLAWMLQHDLIGRRFGKGFDRAGAVAAYRKAIALDPKDKETEANLAILLEHDAAGRRYGDPAQVREAVAEYQRLRRDLKSKTYDSNLAIALLRSEQFREAKEFARELPAGAQRDAILLTAIAASEGADAAIAEADRLANSAESRRAALEAAGRTLILFRRYDAVARLLTEAAGRAPKPGELLTLAETFQRIHRYEETSMSPDDPGTPVRKLVLAALGPPGAPSIASILGEHLLEGEKDADVQFLTGVRRAVSRNAKIEEVPPAVVLDLLFANMTATREGSEALGYRLSINMLGASNPLQAFVTREKGQLRIVGFGDDPELLGAEVLDRAGRGDLDGSRQWLDWAREDLTQGGGDDPLGGPLLRRFWTKGSRDGRARIELAGASLACEVPNMAAAARRVLGDAALIREAGASAEDVELIAAVCAESVKDWKDLEARSGRLFASYPSSDRAFRLRSTALLRLQRYDEAERIAGERLAKGSDDELTLTVLNAVHLGRGDFAGVESAYRAFVDRGKATQIDFNNLAWSCLFTRVSDKTLEWAQKGAGVASARSANGLHTLAAVYAELDRSVQAREALLESLTVKGADAPEPHDWYVLGRIAENYGETETARESYRRVTAPEDRPIEGSTYQLAQRRLAAIPPADGKASR